MEKKQYNLLNEITTWKHNKGKSNLTSGNKYQIEIAYNGKKTSFYFNDNYMNKSDKLDYINALLLDADAYEGKDLRDFMDEFGYSNVEIAKKIYDACGKNYAKLHYLFNENEIDILREAFCDF